MWLLLRPVMCLLFALTAFMFAVMATLEPRKDGKISIIGIAYVVCANLIGSLIGTACAAIIKPGEFRD